MIPIRVLVVDDSIVIRKLLSDTLSGDPALKVVVRPATDELRWPRFRSSIPT